MARVGRNRVVGTGFAGNLVEFIKIDDAVLSFFDIFVSGIVEVADGDLYVGAYEAGFREAGGIGNSERDVL